MRRLLPLLVLLLAFASTALVSAASGPYHLERALAAQRALVLERPNDASAQVDLGNLLRLDEDETGAEAAYRRAIELDPASATAHFHLGLLLQARGERRAALKEYRTTLELDPKNAWAEYQQGSIFHAWGAKPLALRAYARAFALEPRLADERVNPEVIDNELALQAVLRSNRIPRTPIEPPKQYAEPARIAALLLQRPTENAATEPQIAEEPAAEGENGGFARLSEGQSGSERGATSATAEAPEEGSTARVLSSRDLDPSKSTGQISGGGQPAVVGVGGVATRPDATRPSVRTRGEARPRSDRGATTSAPSGTKPSVGPVRGGSSSSGGGSSRGGSRGGTNSGGGWTPSTDSTGRIETHLVPPGELIG